MDLLNAWKQNTRGKGPPPTPLILAGWNFSGDFEKNAVWEATKQWANEMNLSYLIPELTDKQSYFVTSMQSYSCASEYWNYCPREKPAKGEIDIAIKKLKDNWGSIVGPELAEITAPECFTGKKGVGCWLVRILQPIHLGEPGQRNRLEKKEKRLLCSAEISMKQFLQWKSTILISLTHNIEKRKNESIL